MGELAPIDEDGEGEDWDDEDNVGRATRISRYVETPTAAEIEAHNAIHILAEPWCLACVEGKSRPPRTAD